MTDHRFGGPWTEVKLSAINAYAQAYMTALQSQPFELWYIDALAGTGSRVSSRTVGGILDGRPVHIVDELLAGSAQHALSIVPPFQHLRLIERNQNHLRQLESLRDAHPDRDIEVLPGDANAVLPEIFNSQPWTSLARGKMQRALVFLDPYGMNVRWDTLRLLAATERVDVWYLVNLKGACQQMPHDYSRLDAGKRSALSKFFGGEDWEEEFYSVQPSAQGDLLSLIEKHSVERRVTRERIGQFYRQRLQQKLFRYVSEPLSLRVINAEDYFQLYCLSNNRSQKALSLIDRLAGSVIKKHAAAFRQMSDR